MFSGAAFLSQHEGMSTQKRDNLLSIAQWRDEDESKNGNDEFLVDAFVLATIFESVRNFFFVESKAR